MKFSSVSSTEVLLKESMPAGHQSCSDLDTESSMFTPDDSTSVIAETSLDTKTKTMNVIFKNCNAVLVGQVEQMQPVEPEVNSTTTLQWLGRPAVSEEESQQKIEQFIL